MAKDDTSIATNPVVGRAATHHCCICLISCTGGEIKRIVTHNVRTNEKSRENIRPAILAVGLIEATAKAMVV